MNGMKSILLAGGAVALMAASAPATQAQTGPTNVQTSLTGAKPASTPADSDIKATLANTPAVPKSLLTSKTLDPQLKQYLQNLDDNLTSIKAQTLGQAGNAPGAAPQGKTGQNTSAAQTTTTPPIPNSDSNYLDDHLEWNMPVYIYPTGSDGVDLNSTYCLPANTTVVGLDSKYTTGTPPNTTTAQNYLPVRLHDIDGKTVLNAPIQKQSSTDANGNQVGVRRCDNIDVKQAMKPSAQASKDLDTALPIFDDTQFFVGASDLDHTSSRAGWDFGTLVVPFKFQMSDKSIVTGSATLGGYVGYNIGLDLPGFRVSPVGFVGVSEISLPQQSGGNGNKTSSETVAGLSYGVGLMGTIKDSFNISLVFGADHVSGNKSYQYQDKPWVSFALGYSFTK